MTEKCTLCTPGRDTDGFANVCLCEHAGGFLNGYVCDGKGNLTTLSELRAAADLLARVREGCDIGKSYREPHGGDLAGIVLRGPADLLRELAGALGK